MSVSLKNLKKSPEKLRQSVKYERYKRSCPEFVLDCVKIEDKDSFKVVPFDMWPAQRGVLDVFVEERLVVVLKARQLGLSWLALAYSMWNILFKSGFWVVALSKRETPDAKELARRMKLILRYAPDWMVQEHGNAAPGWKGPTWESTSLTVTVHHPGGEDSVFQSLTSSPESGRSLTANLILLDEWAFQQHAEYIYTSAYPTINRPTGGQILGISTGKRGTLFEQIWDGGYSGDNNFYPVFLSWRSDPNRDDVWYDRTKRDMPNTYRQEYPSTPEEAFMVTQGAFFPEWDPGTHILDEVGWYPPKYCRLYGAYDAGYGSRACFKWYAVFPDGRAVCYREYYPKQVTDPEQALAINKMSVDTEGEEEIIETIYGDPSCWNKQSSTGESTAEIFLNLNGKYDHDPIKMLPADNELANGWRRLHQWLNPGPKGEPALRFTYAAANSIRTYPACESSEHNPEDISKKSEHHCQDVDRYFVMSRPQPQPGQERGKVSSIPKELIEDEIQQDGSWYW